MMMMVGVVCNVYQWLDGTQAVARLHTVIIICIRRTGLLGPSSTILLLSNDMYKVQSTEYRVQRKERLLIW